jgi:hypothetical protein
MKTRLFDLLLLTEQGTKVLKALTDKEIVLLIAEKELTGEWFQWIARPAADAGRPTPRSA